MVVRNGGIAPGRHRRDAAGESLLELGHRPRHLLLQPLQPAPLLPLPPPPRRPRSAGYIHAAGRALSGLAELA
jgi:hypothetical protein